MKPAIRIENLGKRYRVNHAVSRHGYRTLRDTLVDMAAAPVRRFRAGGHAGTVEEFWALRDVSFDIMPGEVVGIIGRNGAGKSTLLKILSRVTKPSTGRVTVNGRVGSLLEVGTGFHPELTGRENIYLNGSILGMSRVEIASKFDEIVDFSGVEKFLDTPVKRYSSGMQVRLAFAVAAHLDPEIIVVDEVLAVGDIAFQRKCLGRMRDVSHSGRTVLFVSHNMAAVESLCTTAIMLDRGTVAHDGSVDGVIKRYHQSTLYDPSTCDGRDNNLNGTYVKSVYLVDSQGDRIDYLPVGASMRLVIGVDCKSAVDHPTVGIGFDDSLGQRVLTVHTPVAYETISRLDGACHVECTIPDCPLAPGDYSVKVALSSGRHQLEAVENAMRLRVADGELFDEGRGFTRGVCVSRSTWRLTPI